MKIPPRDRPYLDAIVDGAGGDIIAKAVMLLKVRFILRAILQNEG
jgi:hypothetical protein